MSTTMPAVHVAGVSKTFRIYQQRNQTLKQTLLTGRRARYEKFLALNDVSLDVAHGTTFGLIGQNGSGKSTLLKCIAGILRPDKGSVDVDGRLAALLELGAGFHPEYTGRENIYLNGALLGLSRKDVDRVLTDIVEFSELERFIDNAVKTYSSGMYARLGFSIAAHVDPDVLVVDEILAVGDEAFQRRCYDRIDQMKAQGKTLIVVSHAMQTIRDHCRDCAWVDAGVLRAIGRVDEVVPQYLAEVRERELAAMEHAVAELHRQVPSGRAGVGVTKVTFVNPQGEGLIFDSGDDLEIRVDYHSPAQVLSGAIFGISLVREDGLVVFTTSLETGPDLPGNGTITLRLPSLPLMEGLYRAGVTIADADTEEPYTVLANAFPFRIRGGEEGARGVVALDHRWSVPASGGKLAGGTEPKERAG